MPIQISRRWFVFGSVAAVAAAAIPESVKALQEPVERLPSAHVYLRRMINEFQFRFVDVPSHANEDAVVSLFVHRKGALGGDLPIFQYRMNVHAAFRWVGPWLEGIVVMPEDTFELRVDSNQRVGKFVLIAEDKVDEGPPIRLCEVHDWPSTGPVQPKFFEVDNSLEARLARQAMPPAPPIDWDEIDEDDDAYSS